MVAIPFIQPAPYYVGLALFYVCAVTLGLCFIFLSTALIGCYHTVRKDQDKQLMYFLTGQSLFALVHVCTIAAALQYKPGMDCKGYMVGGTFMYIPAKPLLFLFLARKASLVQYSANAGKWLFIADYVMIALYFFYYIIIFAVPGIINVGKFTDPSNGLAICLTSATSSLPSAPLIMEVILNLLNLYMFIKPLRAHQQESKRMGETMSGNSKLLGTVIRRNMIGAIFTIFFTFFTNLYSIVSQQVMGKNLGLLVMIYATVVIDETVQVLCQIYVCHNAWEIPFLQRRAATGATTNTSAGKSSQNGNEVSGQV
jgi:hypothetical protein